MQTVVCDDGLLFRLALVASDDRDCVCRLLVQGTLTEECFDYLSSDKEEVESSNCHRARLLKRERLLSAQDCQICQRRLSQRLSFKLLQRLH
jgi:hypothetical protein